MNDPLAVTHEPVGHTTSGDQAPLAERESSAMLLAMVSVVALAVLAGAANFWI